MNPEKEIKEYQAFLRKAKRGAKTMSLDELAFMKFCQVPFPYNSLIDDYKKQLKKDTDSFVKEVIRRYKAGQIES